MRLFTIPLLTAFSFIFAPGAYARLYACGGFNGWNALNPAEFAFSEGLYTLDIDFSVSDELKISTVKGETGNGWGEFDTGTLYPETAVLAGRWVPLKAQGNSARFLERNPSRAVYKHGRRKTRHREGEISRRHILP